MFQAVGFFVRYLTIIFYAFFDLMLFSVMKCKNREVKIYHLLTESEVITGKSQTEALMY